VQAMIQTRQDRIYERVPTHLFLFRNSSIS
jgi:hypothetical protein